MHDSIQKLNFISLDKPEPKPQHQDLEDNKMLKLALTELINLNEAHEKTIESLNQKLLDAESKLERVVAEKD